MRSRSLLTHVLGMAFLALTVMAHSEAKADPAARDKWASDDGNITLSILKGDEWTLGWRDNEKKQAGIILLKLVKTTDAARVFEQRTGDPAIGVTVGAKEVEIKTEKAGPASGKTKGSWK